jgi:hypothetical protein
MDVDSVDSGIKNLQLEMHQFKKSITEGRGSRPRGAVKHLIDHSESDGLELSTED